MTSASASASLPFMEVLDPLVDKMTVSQIMQLLSTNKEFKINADVVLGGFVTKLKKIKYIHDSKHAHDFDEPAFLHMYCSTLDTENREKIIGYMRFHFTSCRGEDMASKEKIKKMTLLEFNHLYRTQQIDLLYNILDPSYVGNKNMLCQDLNPEHVYKDEVSLICYEDMGDLGGSKRKSNRTNRTNRKSNRTNRKSNRTNRKSNRTNRKSNRKSNRTAK